MNIEPTQAIVPVTAADRDARVSRYLADHAASRERMATFPESIRQRLDAWQTAQKEWFSDIMLECIAEFIAFDDAHSAPAGEPVAWMYERDGDPFPPSILTNRHEAGDFWLMASNGWTETPLYAHPAPAKGHAELVEALAYMIRAYHAETDSEDTLLPVKAGAKIFSVASATAALANAQDGSRDDG